MIDGWLQSLKIGWLTDAQSVIDRLHRHEYQGNNNILMQANLHLTYYKRSYTCS